MTPPAAIATRNLVKRYGRRRALDGFTLAVPYGAILGLVGPNGAGKTTWMMIAAGLIILGANVYFSRRIRNGKEACHETK